MHSVDFVRAKRKPARSNVNVKFHCTRATVVANVPFLLSGFRLLLDLIDVQWSLDGNVRF